MTHPKQPIAADITAATRGLSLRRASVDRLDRLVTRHMHSDLFASRCILMAVEAEQARRKDTPS